MSAPPASRAASPAAVRRTVVALAIALIGIGSPLPARAVLIRHDQPDTSYRLLALGYEHAVGNVGGAMGTLIADRWVLTAAHVVDNISPFSRSFRMGAERIPIDAVFLYPGWSTRRNAAGKAEIESSIPDLALLRLARPVRGVTPVRLYRKSGERGMRCVVIGTGVTGTGESGPADEDGVMRAATNVIDEAAEGYLAFSFSAPSDPRVTDLEGIGGPGDSGGPLLAREAGRLYVLGVSSINSVGSAAGPSRYGSTEVYARVSASLAWIDATLAGHSRALAVADTVENVSDGWPATPAGRLVASWLDAYNNRDSLALVAFERTFRADSLLAKKPAEARAATWLGLYGDWGRLDPVRWVETAGAPMRVLVHAAAPDRWMRFDFVLQAESPHKLTAMRTNWPEDPPDSH